MHKNSTIIIFLTFSILAIIACTESRIENNEAVESETHLDTITSGVKVPIRNGRLVYHISENRGTPFLESINSFLNWYSEEELMDVNVLVISNRDSTTGEIRPLVTTAGIERLVNLEKIEISTSGIQNLDGVDQLMKLVSMDLYGNKIQEIVEISNLKNLQYLSLVGNPIESLLDIVSSESLIALGVDRTEITTLEGLERFPNLISLGATSNALTDVTDLAKLEHLQGVEILSRENNLNAASIELLERMKRENPEMYLEWEIK